MAFTRTDTGQTTSFTRDGATTFQSTPGFQIFNVVSGPSSFSLNNKWTLHTELGTTPNLKFKYNGNTMLELTNNGVNNLLMPSVTLTNNSSSPSTSGYYNGDIVKVQGELYILTGGNNN